MSNDEEKQLQKSLPAWRWSFMPSPNLLSPVEQMLWVIDAELKDHYELCLRIRVLLGE
jgi:hypothetical protein